MPINSSQALLKAICRLAEHRHQTANIIDTISEHSTTQHLQKRNHKGFKLITGYDIPKPYSREHRRSPIPPIKIQVKFSCMVKLTFLRPSHQINFLFLLSNEIEQQR